MPFLFALDAVLHFRTSVEHQQELRLRSCNQQVARVRRLLEQIDTHLSLLRTERGQQLAAGAASSELQFDLSCEAAVRKQRDELERELAHVQRLRDQQQRVFHQARRERETIESLKDRQLREYNREAARREQRQLDDLHLLRRSYRNHG